MNWENLKYLLAFYRAGSLSSAADRLGVDATTVSRRLTALQKEIGTQLLERSASGSLELTSAGQKAVTYGETLETSLNVLTSELTGAGLAEEGMVRISSVPVVNTRILMPQVSRFCRRHPGIELHLASEIRNVSLTRRETDMAIRLGRPRDGGQNVTARRIAVLEHAAYGPAGVCAEDLPWITYHENMSFLPQARWMADHLKGEGAAIARIRPSDLEGVIEAVAAGIGRSIIPKRLAGTDHRLQMLDAPKPDLQREVWLMQHADQAGLARMLAVSRWIEELFS
ncbi:LysR family transcriptional regulator [Roseibium sp.]|uniref:LysR family transcriptional regulator n=1 Tax=Roseibium sp. TaxID=1936156 RepID=UPI003BAB4B14